MEGNEWEKSEWIALEEFVINNLNKIYKTYTIYKYIGINPDQSAGGRAAKTILSVTSLSLNMGFAMVHGRSL